MNTKSIRTQVLSIVIVTFSGLSVCKAARPNYWMGPPELKTGTDLIKIEMLEAAYPDVRYGNGSAVTSPVLVAPDTINAGGRDVYIWQKFGVCSTHTKIKIIHPRRVYMERVDWWPAGYTDIVPALDIRDIEELVHIERCRFVMSDRFVNPSISQPWPAVGQSGDVIRWRGLNGTTTTYPTLVMQGVQVWNVRGVYPDVHADWLQQDGPSGNVYVYDVTGSTNYQTFLCVPLTGSVYTPTGAGKAWRFRNVNFYGFGGRRPAEEGGCQPFYLKSGSGAASEAFDLRFANGTVWYHHGWDDWAQFAQPIPNDTTDYGQPDFPTFSYWNSMQSPYCPQFSGDVFSSSAYSGSDGDGVRFVHVSGSLDKGFATTSVGINTASGNRGGYLLSQSNLAALATEVGGSSNLGYVLEGVPPGGDYCKDDMVGPNTSSYAVGDGGIPFNVAQGKAITVDSEYGTSAGYLAGNAVDGLTKDALLNDGISGNDNYRWVSKWNVESAFNEGGLAFSDKHWARIDLGGQYNLFEIQLFKNAGYEVTDFEVFGDIGSGSTSNYVSLANITGSTAVDASHQFPVKTVKSILIRFNRMNGPSGTDAVVRLFEIRVLGVPKASKPNSPGNVTVSQLQGVLHVAWTDNSYVEENYVIAFRKSGDSDFETLGSLPRNTTSVDYSGVNLEPATSYTFRVYAANGQGVSSSDTTFTTSP